MKHNIPFGRLAKFPPAASNDGLETHFDQVSQDKVLQKLSMTVRTLRLEKEDLLRESYKNADAAYKVKLDLERKLRWTRCGWAISLVIISLMYFIKF